jgi:hypothetical protein
MDTEQLKSLIKECIEEIQSEELKKNPNGMVISIPTADENVTYYFLYNKASKKSREMKSYQNAIDMARMFNS